jgi:hypothetical protein
LSLYRIIADWEKHNKEEDEGAFHVNIDYRTERPTAKSPKRGRLTRNIADMAGEGLNGLPTWRRDPMTDYERIDNLQGGPKKYMGLMRGLS